MGSLSTWILLAFLTQLASAQVFQYFVVDNNDQSAHVLGTVKLPTCTHIDIKENVTLRGGIKAGNFTKHGIVQSLQTCIDACCQDKTCDVAFMPGHTCYTVSCFNKHLCDSIPAVPSHAANGSVQISHIVRGGGNGDNLANFRKYQGIDRFVEKEHCVPSRVAYNYTLRGGKFAGHMQEFGKVSHVRECIGHCCENKICEVALMINNDCYGVDCFTRELCQGIPLHSKHLSTALVYMNQRSSQRGKDKDKCKEPCLHGLCSREDKCMCDMGWDGPHCDKVATHGNCGVPGCGKHGRCTGNDTCHCSPGYFGYYCNETLTCSPPCIHGACVDDKAKEVICNCDFGWEGQFCNISNGDKLVSSVKGEEVLFTKMNDEAEMDIKIHEQPSPRAAESISALAVAIGCGIAAAIVGTAAVAFIARRILGNRNTHYELLRDTIHHNTQYHIN